MSLKDKIVQLIKETYSRLYPHYLPIGKIRDELTRKINENVEYLNDDFVNVHYTGPTKDEYDEIRNGLNNMSDDELFELLVELKLFYAYVLVHKFDPSKDLPKDTKAAIKFIETYPETVNFVETIPKVRDIFFRKFIQSKYTSLSDSIQLNSGFTLDTLQKHKETIEKYAHLAPTARKHRLKGFFNESMLPDKRLTNMRERINAENNLFESIEMYDDLKALYEDVTGRTMNSYENLKKDGAQFFVQSLQDIFRICNTTFVNSSNANTGKSWIDGLQKAFDIYIQNNLKNIPPFIQDNRCISTLTKDAIYQVKVSGTEVEEKRNACLIGKLYKHSKVVITTNYELYLENNDFQMQTTGDNVSITFYETNSATQQVSATIPLSDFKEFLPLKQEGGRRRKAYQSRQPRGQKSHLVLKGEKRIYKVHANDQKAKYIKKSGQVLLLSSIKGKYTYI